MSVAFDFGKIQTSTFREFPEEISAIAYHNGKIAVALNSANERIEIWHYESNKCELKIDTNGQDSRCLKFDCNIIMSMINDTNTLEYIRSWELPSGRNYFAFKGGVAPCRSFDYCSALNIVVGSSEDSSIYIWDVRTGQELKCIKQEDNSIHKIYVDPVLSDDPQSSTVFNLLVLKDKEVEMWEVKLYPDDMSVDKVKIRILRTVYPSRNPFKHSVRHKIDILQFKEKFLYYFQYFMNYNKIVVFDLEKNLLHDEIKVERIVKSILAVGGKNIAFQTEVPDKNEEFFVVIDRVSGKEVAQTQLPSELQTIGKDEYLSVIIGDTSWLDDLNEVNDKNILCICVRKKQIISVITCGENNAKKIDKEKKDDTDNINVASYYSYCNLL